MKLTRWLVVAAIVISLGAAAKADTVDPAIGVKQGTGGGGSPVFGVEGFFFDCGGPTVTCSLLSDFLDNGTGADIVALDFKFSVPQLTGISLATPELNDYQSSFTGFDLISDTEAILFAQNGESPIPSCATAGESCPGEQTLQLFAQNMNGSVTVTSVPAPVPEPATLVLLGSGLGAMYIKRRATKKKLSLNSLS